ncbi:MAG: antibiotic biosynthesis monooxygenase family protein [Rhodospirillales bacterium]
MSGKIALMVEFGVKAERRQDFLALMRSHAKMTLDSEPGCEQFDVLDPAAHNGGGESGSVFLYELYTDQAAVDAHMNSALLASTRGSYDDMITTKRVVWCDVG